MLGRFLSHSGSNIFPKRSYKSNATVIQRDGYYLRRLMATCLLAVIVASLIVPAHLMISIESESGMTPLVDASSESSPPLSSISFSQSIDTSQIVLEYPLVSRALMLPGGSVDVTMGDINGDGLDDIIAAVSDEMMISVFYGQIDGVYSSYPSYNISLLKESH